MEKYIFKSVIMSCHRTTTLLRHLSSANEKQRQSSCTVKISPSRTKSAPQGNDLEDSYDFIIVGGGTAGCILASRLSENPNWNVLLVEAGNVKQDTSMKAEIPISYSELQLTDIDWQFKTVPQKQQFGRVSLWPRGKTLGGCSTINALLYVRCDPKGYDEWENLGCPG